MNHLFQNLWKLHLSVILITIIFNSNCLLSSNISEVKTYGNFETAGVIIKVDGMNFNETAQIEYKKAGTGSYKIGHDFLRYDGNHFATSLFKLDLNTTYDLRITLFDPDGVTGTNPMTATVTTKPEFSIPIAIRVVNVVNQTELDDAITNLQAGDEIRLAAGTYSNGINFNDKSGTFSNPIVFTSQDNTKPIIQGNVDGGFVVGNGSYIILNNLEVHNESGNGVFFRGCHDMVITNCYIHDSRPGDYTANIVIQHGEEGTPVLAGNFLIMNNIISDETHDVVDENQGPGEPNTQVNGQSYFGIDCRYTPGPFITIRNNVIYGVVDGIHPCADEGGAPVMDPDELDVLNSWVDRELDIYNNVIYDCKDDCLELDGHMINGRVFRNRLGKCENSISVAPFYAGPLYIIRNYLCGFHQNCLKQNTGVEGIFRGVLFYHNTIMEKPRTIPAHCENENCLYRGEPALQQNFVYKNNIFYARGRVYNGDMYSGGYHRYDTLDYNINYSTKEAESANPYVYKWVSYDPDPLNNSRYETMEAFRTATGQEQHGIWGDPKLNSNQLLNFPAGMYLYTMTIDSSSVGVDKGVLINGINNEYIGSGPDIGAFESSITGIEEQNETGKSPIKAVQMCPNPFSDAVSINVIIESGIELKVDILDVLGNNVKTLFEGKSETNELNLVWSSDSGNNKMSSGIYLLRIRAGSSVITEKLILSR